MPIAKHTLTVRVVDAGANIALPVGSKHGGEGAVQSIWVRLLACTNYVARLLERRRMTGQFQESLLKNADTLEKSSTRLLIHKLKQNLKNNKMAKMMMMP